MVEYLSPKEQTEVRILVGPLRSSISSGNGMNLEFKETVFRYIFPACLFWAPVVLDALLFRELDRVPYLPDIGLAIIVIFATGIAISMIGAFVTELFGRYAGPRWSRPDTEVEYWEELAKKVTECTRNKIDRRWNFFSTYLNSFLALLFAALLLVAISPCDSVIIVSTLILSFVSFHLFFRGYDDMCAFDKILSAIPKKEE